jgi:hypothetical protein
MPIRVIVGSLVLGVIAACSSSGDSVDASGGGGSQRDGVNADGGDVDGAAAAATNDDGKPIVAGCGSRRDQGKDCKADEDCCSLHCEYQTTGTPARCAMSTYGQPCDDTNRCANSTCRDGVCGLGAIGDACTSGPDCNSDTCDGGACSCDAEPSGSCRTGADCCAGLACVDGTCTKPAAAACGLDDECMSHSCVGGRCACVPHASLCATDADCCAGPCRNGICATPAGEACSTSDECLRVDDPDNGLIACHDGTCVCGRVGGTCGVDSDCCSNHCQRIGPTLRGTCSEALPGDACTIALDCAYTSASYGHPACGADGKCKCSPDQGVCRTDAHCCGGSCVNGVCNGGPPAQKCVRIFQASTDGNDCCPGLLAPGGPQTACCGAPGHTCTHPYDCCSNACGANGRCP